MKSDVLILLEDIRFVEIHCQHCGTFVTMDMQEEKSFSNRPGAFAPKTCPGCQKDYDSAVKAGVDGFKSAYQTLLNFPSSVTFRGTSSSREGA
jgi:hypothetical protein